MLRKKLIKIGMTIGVGAMAIGVFWNLNNNNNNNKISKPIIPEDLMESTQKEEEQFPIFQKSKTEYDELKKYAFKEIKDRCVYSLDDRIFLLTEDSNSDDVICFADCSTEQKARPLAITRDGDFMVLETEEGEKIAVKMEASQSERIIEPNKNLIQFESFEDKDSLFKLEIVE
ncbi:MAG: hypothetical protein ACLUHC_03960 [Clostridia bacterium]